MIKVKENGKNEIYESVNNQYNRMINYRTIFQMPNTRILYILSPENYVFGTLIISLEKLFNVKYPIENEHGGEKWFEKNLCVQNSSRFFIDTVQA